jgi:pyridoxamine 5'-phosphate oxidase
MNRNVLLTNAESDPINLFKNWFEEASISELNDPNAMNLSTISKDLKPSSRMVLLKNFSQSGFIFYTNINSKKGESINENSNVALNFHWKSLLKQVRIEGKAQKVLDDEADEYYNSRAEDSKIGAWASNQSSKLLSREELENRVKYYKKKFQNKKITRPAFWTGYRVEPNLIEFWHDMPFRLHDRLEYKKINNAWVANRLYP